MNRSFAFTCLLFFSLQIPLVATNSAVPFFNSAKSTRVLSDIFSETFVVESLDSSLQLNVFTSSGRQMPVTIYRHHTYGKVLYEVGQELPKGLYLIKLTYEDFNITYKLMKMNH